MVASNIAITIVSARGESLFNEIKFDLKVVRKISGYKFLSAGYPNFPEM